MYKMNVMTSSMRGTTVVNDYYMGKMLKQMMKEENMMSLLMNDPQRRFDILTNAVMRAGLQDLLIHYNGPYTFFAPTDDAFMMLSMRVNTPLEVILARENLEDILKYHMTDSKVTSSELSTGEITMLNDKTVDVSVQNGTVTLGGSVVVIDPDCEGVNGCIHVVNGVLPHPSLMSVPQQMMPMPMPMMPMPMPMMPMPMPMPMMPMPMPMPRMQ